MFIFISEISPAINGIVGASLALFIVPRFLRARKTGEYVGFREFTLLYIFLGWGALKALTIFPELGLTWEAALRTLITTCVPFAGAYVWVKLTDHFGWDKSHQIRH